MEINVSMCLRTDSKSSSYSQGLNRRAPVSSKARVCRLYLLKGLLSRCALASWIQSGVSFIPMTIHTKWMELLRTEAIDAFEYGTLSADVNASFIDGQIKLMKSESTRTW